MELNEENKKTKLAVKNLEKRSLEDIISSNNYYDLSRKHNRRKNSIDINYLFTDVVKTDEINLGKKFKAEIKAETELKISEKNKEDKGIEKISDNMHDEFNDKNNLMEEC